jgi:phosphocarrier protein HPr
MVKCDILLDTIDKIADFIKVVSKIEYDVDLVKGRYTVDAKSVVGVFTLDLSKEAKIIIYTDDENILDKFNEWRVD